MEGPCVPKLAPHLLPVLDGLRRALSTKELVRETGLSPNTVSKYTQAIFVAFEVRSRAVLLLKLPPPA